MSEASGGAVHACAALLAAGQSRRMGERNKLLIEIDGQPLVRRTALVYLAAGADLRVVVGHDAARVRDALAGLPAVFVENPDYATGRSSSARAGLRGLPAGYGAVLVALADQAALTPDDIGGLLRAFADAGGRRILIPCHRGARGNPVVFPPGVVAEIAAADSDLSCRAYIDANPSLVQRYEAPNNHFVLDIDTPDDLSAFIGPNAPNGATPRR